MKFFATSLLSLLSITLGIQAVAATDQIPLPNAPMDANLPTPNSRLTLFDLLTIEPRTSIFFSYARELELGRLFVDVDSNLTLLVPTNKAVMALARKPYVFPIAFHRPRMMLSHFGCSRDMGNKVTKRRSQLMTPLNCLNKS
jgi:hypothetical protein